MILRSPQIVRSLLVCALVFAQIAALFASPWFHRHPGEDHAETDGEVYHTHLPSSASSSSESESNTPHSEEMAHLGTGEPHQPPAVMPGSLAANCGKTLALSNQAADRDACGLSAVLPSPSLPTPVIQSLLRPLHVLPSQDNSVLIETDLPPPLA